MAIVVKDRVRQSASAPGTGTITLGATTSGFQAFSAIGNGNVTYFAIVDAVSGAWEVNYGTYTSSGTTLSRNATPLSSSNAGALVNFTGAVDVFCTYPASKSIYEETTGNVLIDGGPITVIGAGVTSYTTFSAALGELYANINSFAQFYAQNLSDGSSASTDIVAYNDAGDGTNNFVDMGISSSNYTDAAYPIFTPGSGYVYNNGGEMIIGSQTDDLLLFAGGVATTDWAVRVDKTSKLVTTKAALTLGGALTGVGASFTSPVTTTSSMLAPGATEFITRAYVDEATSNGFHVHTPVLVATTGNLTATYNQPGGAGDGVGATLTNSGTQVALSIDGVSMAVNDRILVWQQTSGLQNGVYVVTTVGTGATNWVLTRSADANTSSEGDPGTLGGGDYFFVQSGTTQGFFAFICTNTSAIVFGTTSIDFNEFSQVPVYIGTAPINVSGQTIALTGTVAATNGGTGQSTVTTGDLLYGSGTNTWGKLAAGAGYKSLVMNAGGTQVEWNAVSLNQSGAVSGALGATNGGTGQSTYTLGDTLYSSASDTLAKLAGNTTTTKKFMVQTGTGAASAAPVWDVVNGADVNGNITGQAGSVANALTLGTYLTGTSYNGGTAVTATVDATSANTASKVVARDASGDFSAGTITAALAGNATTATTATNVAGGTANQIVYNTSAGTTSFAAAPSASNQLLSWNGSAYAWTLTPTVTSLTVSGGTANGVTYLNGSQVLTSGSTLTFDGTKLGIGTASPVANLEVSSATGSATPTPTEIRISTTTSAADFSTSLPWGRLSFYSADVTDAGPKIQGAVDLVSATTAGGRGSMVFKLAAATTGTLTERMRVTSTGTVGIASAGPTYQLQIGGNGQDTANLTDAGLKGGSLYLQAGATAGGAGGAVLFGTNFGNSTPFAAIKGLIFSGDTNTTGDLAFSTRVLDADTALTEQMRLTIAGNVGLGTTTPIATAGYRGFSISGSTGGIVEILAGATSVGKIEASATGVQVNSVTAQPLTLKTNNADRVTVDSVGSTYIETGNLWQYAPAPATRASAGTLTAAQLFTGILNTTGTTYTVTVPTGTNIDALYPQVPAVDIGFDFFVINTASGTITMAVNTGVTSLGALTIATATSAMFRFRRTAANTYVMYRLR